MEDHFKIVNSSVAEKMKVLLWSGSGNSEFSVVHSLSIARITPGRNIYYNVRVYLKKNLDFVIFLLKEKCNKMFVLQLVFFFFFLPFFV